MSEFTSGVYGQQYRGESVQQLSERRRTQGIYFTGSGSQQSGSDLEICKPPCDSE